MAEIYFRFFLKKSLIQNYRLKLFNGMYIHLFINKFSFSCLGCWQMEQDIVNGFFHQLLSTVNKIFVISRHHFQQTVILSYQYGKFCSH